MVAKCFKNTTFLQSIAFVLLFYSNAIQGGGRLSKQEDLKLDRQLQLINKPAIKSLQTKYGDIVDCIDIYKQLAFDHPLLKNHTIQMKPKTFPKGMKDEGSRTNVFPTYVANISCPLGSIPVKRTTKEDLLMDKYQKSARKKHPINPWRLQDPNTHFAAMMFSGQNYGAKAAINIWKPTVSTTQYSRACIQIESDSEVISAGWEVRKWNYTRLYISWSRDIIYGSECRNDGCPGFVQVSHKIALGSYLNPSIYNGHQYEIKITLFQDHITGHWWFLLRNEYIGYWPQELFKNLSRGGSAISWGGRVPRVIGEVAPAMGSGHFPSEGYRKSAFVKGIKIITNKTKGFEDPYKPATSIITNMTDCYNAQYKVLKDPLWGHHVYFGGPGKCRDEGW